MATCPFNAKHIHPKPEHQHHLMLCPDRTLIDRDIIYGENFRIERYYIVVYLSEPHTFNFDVFSVSVEL